MTEQHTYPRVPYGMSVHGEEEIAAVVEVLRTSTQLGKNVREFERRVAEVFGKRHGVMVNSGSSALLLAAEVLALPPGSEVITPALTFSTTVSSLLKNQLVPAFVDVEEGTYCIDPDLIEDLITPNTRALSVPNLIGNVAKWDRIQEVARHYGLVTIEDSADTLGATLQGKPTGVFSDISTTSFYGSHVINCAGNGGMLLLNDDVFATRGILLRSWGRSSSLFGESEDIGHRFGVRVDGLEYDAKFVFEAPGYNLEPSELGAAFGLVQLKRLQENIESRIANFQSHSQFFAEYEDWFVLPRQTSETRTGWLAFPLTIREEAPFTRRELQIFLEKQNIQTRVIFTGNILRQPGFSDIPARRVEAGYRHADQVMRGGILLGCHHGLTDAMVGHIHQSFRDFASRTRNR